METDMRKFTFVKKFEAHYGDTTVIVPDQVAANQREYDLARTQFPAKCRDGKRIRVRLDGKSYGLHTMGTGDMIVRR
jgi:hypothetical protein